MTRSTFTWMQFDAKQAERAKELVGALSEPGTLDSLGIGSVRDGFANIFFPGTSTLHSRAIYALAIPWASQYVASRRPRSAKQYDKWFRDAELATARSLVDGNAANEPGIIGRTAGKRLKRLPSEMYWNGLGVWGIRHQVGKPLSRQEVRTLILTDKNGEAALGLWDGVPQAPEGFPNSMLDVLPTPEQARYLLDKFGQTPTALVSAGDSLLAHVAKNPHLSDCGLWEVSTGTSYLSEAMFYARGFALVIQGARLRYLDLLFQARSEKDPEAEYSSRKALDARIDEWYIVMESEKRFTADWISRLNGMFQFLHTAQAVITEPTQRFIALWCRRAVQAPIGAMTDPSLGAAIRTREHDLKRSSARLSNPSPLLNWTGELLGATSLDYRWSYASNLINDCRLGLGTEHA